MDWLTFISKTVGDLEWPGIALLLLWWLRPHLGGLAARLEELTLPGGAKAKFRQELEEAKEKAITVYDFTASVEAVPHHGAEPVGAETRYIQLAAMFPEAAILQSYQEIERIIQDHSNKFRLGGRSPANVISFLQQTEVIDPAAVDVFNRLRTLRNEAAHGGSSLRLSLDEAIEYRALCRFVADALDVAFKKMADEGGTPVAATPG